MRLCDLSLRLDQTWLVDCIDVVRRDLKRKRLRFNPHFWLSEEWFSPAGVPGVAIPFFLAHPRLMRLERAQVLQVEGGTKWECVRILRHELGHAIDHAYRLSARKRWKDVFGRRGRYPDYYRPNPLSKRHVQHLEYWYAQAHPDEDFAETFAVWLAPRSNWRKRYADWPALRKLEYVDQLMDSIADMPPKVRCRERPYSLGSLRKTLRDHYEEKRHRYESGFPDIYDTDLRKLFSADPKHKNQPTAASFLRKHRAEIRRMVAKWTGEYPLTLDLVLSDMIGRVTELRLRAVGSTPKLRMDFALLLTVKTIHHLYRPRHWVAM